MSDRQLNALEWHRLRLDPSVAISRGSLYGYSYTRSLGGSGIDTLHLVTAAKPVALFRLLLQTTGTRGALFELHAGGVVTGGTDIAGFRFNHDQWEAPPLAVARFGATVSVPGVKIGEETLDGEGYASAMGAALPSILVMGAGQDYYLLIHNLHNQAADLRIDLDLAAIAERPPGF